MPRTDLSPRPDPDAWLGPPQSAELKDDHAVDLRGDSLVGRRVALLICGGIAAFKAPLTVRALRRQGAEVTCFASPQALRYVTADTLEWASLRPIVTQLSAQAEHLSGSGGFDAYLVAPATYNTLNKMAMGIADTVLTATLASALGRMQRGTSATLVAPTMHGTMHNTILVESLQRLRALGVRVIPPRDAYGKDNIPEEAVLVAEVAAALPDAPLRARRVIVLGDAGGHGQRIAVDLIHRGAQVLHLNLPSKEPPSPVSAPVIVVDRAELSKRLTEARQERDWHLVIDASGSGLGDVDVTSQGDISVTAGGKTTVFSSVDAALRDLRLTVAHGRR